MYCELVSIIGDISKLSYVSIVNISIMQVTPVFFTNLVLCVSLNKKKIKRSENTLANKLLKHAQELVRSVLYNNRLHTYACSLGCLRKSF